MERPGHIFSRGKLLDLVWGHGVYVEERTVDVHMSRLRALALTLIIITLGMNFYALQVVKKYREQYE